MKAFLKKILPYLIIIVGFVIIAHAYAPDALSGKQLNQVDTSSWMAMSHEAAEHNEAHPDDQALWTGSMFSGMPANTIYGVDSGNFISPLRKLLIFWVKPVNFLIVSLIGGFLLMLAFGAGIWLSALGAIAITFCSYNMQIIQVGHETKMMAIAFMPWVLASLVFAYRRNCFFGSTLFGITLSMELMSGHPQISYYLAIIIFGYAIAEAVTAIKTHKMAPFVKTSCLVLICGILGTASQAGHLLPLKEYTKHTMRGGSELTTDKQTNRDGLDIDYATAWSYGVSETPNLMIPDFNGGASTGELSRNSHTFEALNGKYQGAEQIIRQLPLYWGPQPFTAGPMYLGAVCVFLFILGLFIVKGPYKWWLAAISLLALMLGWGSHFMWFTEIWFKYVPLYNKFRTVSMVLVLLQISVPLMGVLTLKEIFSQNQESDELSKKLFWSFGITGGFCLLFILFPGLAGDFRSTSDSSLPDDITAALRLVRQALLRADAFRSLAFISVSCLIIWLAAFKRKFKTSVAVTILSLLVLCDLWSVDKRYLNESHFSSPKQMNGLFAKRPVDEMILQDGDPSYRVLDISVNTFNDAIPSYWHKTIGGYNAAKLQRYQDLIDHFIQPEMSRLSKDINTTLSSAKTISDVEAGLGYYPILSMLNTRYIVINGDTPPVRYERASGNAWFVSSVIGAASPDEEIHLLGEIDPASQAVIYEGDGIDVKSLTTVHGGDTGQDYIRMSEYSLNHLEYDYSSAEGGVAVFSEIYYPEGWKAILDGSQELPIMRADWTLRALDLPAGTHHITFTYLPESFAIGRKISMASSIALYILLLAGIIFRKRLPQSHTF
ncbi:MAG: hypothetical protein KBS57_01145 [Alistipes sp.]|nr:hypothetical protein [Candidatus Minthomonas equi]